jgi:hypothetical protein
MIDLARLLSLAVIALWLLVELLTPPGGRS